MEVRKGMANRQQRRASKSKKGGKRYMVSKSLQSPKRNMGLLQSRTSKKIPMELMVRKNND
jgi:hypothetical protein